MSADFAAAAQPAQPVRGKWKTVSALSAAIFVDNLENFTLQILWPSMYPTLGLTVGQLGPVAGVTSAVKTVTSPLWGFLADRYSRRWLLVVVTGIWGLWTAAIGLVQSIDQLLLVRALSSLGIAAFWPIVTSLLSDLFGKEDRGKAAGIMNAVGFVGNFVSFIVLPVLAASSPEAWRVGFIVMGVMSFISGLILLLVEEPPRGAAEQELAGVVAAGTQTVFRWSALPALFGVSSWWLLLLHFVLNNAPINILGVFVFTWLTTLNLGPAVNLVLPIQALGIIAGHLLFGWLGDRAERRDARRGRFLLGLSLLAVHALVLFAFVGLGAGSIAALIGLGLLNALATGALESGVRIPMSQNVLPPELRGTGRAFIEMVLGIVLAGTVTVFGWLVDQSGLSLTNLLLLTVPTVKVLAALAFIPLYWAYPRDIDRLHTALSQRRAALLEGRSRPSGD